MFRYIRTLSLIAIALLLAVFGGTSARAQVDTLLMDKKVQLEEKLSERLREKIATTLNKNSFEISVQVVLEQYTPKESPKTDRRKADPDETKAEPQPQDLTLGLLDAEKILKEYRDQIKTLEESKRTIIQTVQNDRQFYRVKSFLIFAGLREELGAEYFKEFEAWLTQTARTEFGNNVKVKVQSIKIPKELRETPSVTPPQPLTLMRALKEYQSLIAMALLALTLLFAIFTWKTLVSSEAREKRQFMMEFQALGNQGIVQAIKEQTKPEEEKSPLLTNQQSIAHLKRIQDLNSKIALLARNVDIRIQDVIESWAEQSEAGFIKCALFLDALLSAPAVQRGADLHLEFLRSLEFPKEAREGIFNRLRTMGTIGAEERVKHLEDVYWELLAAQTVDPALLNEPYSYLTNVQEKDIIDILDDQPAKLKSMYLLTMPREKQERIVRELPLDAKRVLIQQTFETDEVSESEIVTLSDAFKLKVKAKARGEFKVKTMSILPEILNSLTVREQIHFLNEFSVKYPDKVAALKLDFPSLAFISSWSASFLRRYVEALEAETLLALIAIMPDMQQPVLAVASELSKKIIEDELRQGRRVSDEALDKLLTSAQTRVYQLLERSQKKASEIYATSQSANVTKIAS